MFPLQFMSQDVVNSMEKIDVSLFLSCLMSLCVAFADRMAENAER